MILISLKFSFYLSQNKDKSLIRKDFLEFAIPSSTSVV
nr:MAG TPA: hypothetical protein [Caudoviricetes sp.]